MNDETKPLPRPVKTEAERRAERLAAQLRANLLRRKDQQRARKPSGKTGEPKPE